jgi:ATP/maltotriose-dependent transcriptional regulator MalT
MTTTASTTRQPRQLHTRTIVERPRLFGVLDSSTAPIRTLIAPPGYGKTTLAEQWIARDGRRHVWFTARRSSADVVALALGIVTAATALLPGCDERLRAHLKAVPSSADDPQLLAEIVAEDLAPLSADCWLVLDDYQEIVGGEHAEHFVEALVSLSSVRMLIGSLVRPSWVTTRQIMYGDVLEVSQTALAMDADEAAAVLRDRAPAAGLVALADGWPAVIGLAAVSGAQPGEDVEKVPESLYRFFSEEVYSALGDTVQRGLATLAVMPVLDREVVDELLGPQSSEEVCSAALRVGILVERGAQLELHPLCRTFLDEQSAALDIAPTRDDVDRCLAIYWRRADWDAAFDLVARFELVERLRALLADALDDVLETARLATLASWCSTAAELGIRGPELALARAELALRRGRHTEAQAQAEAAAASGDVRFVFRGLCVAGRAAHLASREEEALALYERAEAAAQSDSERRDALWGQLSSLIDLESPRAAELLEALATGVSIADPREAVQAAGHRLGHLMKFGAVRLDEADMANDLVPAVRDQLVTSSFLSVYSYALALSARYPEALTVSGSLLGVIRASRLDFARAYALLPAAIAQAGQRNWAQSHRTLGKTLEQARRTRDAYARASAVAIRLRVLAQQGEHRTALAIELPELGDRLPALRAELYCSRALVLAAFGRCDAATQHVEKVRGTTSAVEQVVLTRAVEAVCALKTRSRDAADRVCQLRTEAFAVGGLDLLVTAYRACPELLASLLQRDEDDRVVNLVRRVGDEDLASIVGFRIDVRSTDEDALSRREREVYRLLVDGLTNQQIASMLFISPATVKVHVHHIYDKLGIRSRTALAVQAALRRGAAQATAETESSESGFAS